MRDLSEDKSKSVQSGELSQCLTSPPKPPATRPGTIPPPSCLMVPVSGHLMGPSLNPAWNPYSFISFTHSLPGSFKVADCARQCPGALAIEE